MREEDLDASLRGAGVGLVKQLDAVSWVKQLDGVSWRKSSWHREHSECAILWVRHVTAITLSCKFATETYFDTFCRGSVGMKHSNKKMDAKNEAVFFFEVATLWEAQGCKRPGNRRHVHEFAESLEQKPVFHRH